MMRLVFSNNKYQQIRADLDNSDYLKEIDSQKSMVRLGKRETGYILKKYGIDSKLMHRGRLSLLLNTLNQSILNTQITFSSLLLIKTLFLTSLIVAPALALSTFIICLTISVITAWRKAYAMHEADINRFNLLLFNAIDNQETKATLREERLYALAAMSFEAAQLKLTSNLKHGINANHKDLISFSSESRTLTKPKISVSRLTKSIGKGVTAALTNLGLFVSINHLSVCVPALALGLSVVSPWVLPVVCMAVGVIGAYTFMSTYNGAGLIESRRDKLKQLRMEKSILENSLKKMADLKMRYKVFVDKQDRLIKTMQNYRPIFKECNTSKEVSDMKNDRARSMCYKSVTDVYL